MSNCKENRVIFQQSEETFNLGTYTPYAFQIGPKNHNLKPCKSRVVIYIDRATCQMATLLSYALMSATNDCLGFRTMMSGMFHFDFT